MILTFLIPPYQNPDEPTHLEYCLNWRDLIIHGNTNVFSSHFQPVIMTSMKESMFWENAQFSSPVPLPSAFEKSRFLAGRPTQKNNPPLYHIFMGSLFSLIPENMNVATLLYLGRFISVCLSMCSLFIVLLVCKGWNLNGSVWTAGILIFLGFHPGYATISVSFTPDSLAVLFSVLFLLFMSSLVRDPMDFRAWIYVLASMVPGIVTKKTLLFLCPVLFWPLSILFLRTGNKPVLILKLVLTGIICMALFVTITWYFPSEVSKISSVMDIFSNMVFYFKFGNPNTSMWWLDFTKMVWTSYWVSAGWMMFFLSLKSYMFYFFLATVSILMLFFFQRAFRQTHILTHPLKLWGLCLILLLMNILMIYVFGWTEGLAQGRYLYPSLLPAAVLIISGLSAVSLRRRLKWVYPCVLLYYMSYSTLVLWMLLLNSFYA